MYSINTPGKKLYIDVLWNINAVWSPMPCIVSVSDECIHVIYIRIMV